MWDSRELARVRSVSGLDWRESMRDWEKRMGVSLELGEVVSGCRLSEGKWGKEGGGGLGEDMSRA